jgi:hypothetical protein
VGGIQGETLIKNNRMPTFDALMNPLLDALLELGGSVSPSP